MCQGLSVVRQVHAVDLAHRQAEKDASSWQTQLEHSQVQHQKQVGKITARCSALQAERNALTMALSAVAVERLGVTFAVRLPGSCPFSGVTCMFLCTDKGITTWPANLIITWNLR